ncbi:LytTR family transcriptional regulator [Clostridium sp. MSJ-4]|uniref:LytTR family transcriptional regulator n=1 Tax=Clostridium simiarum TaxID=2841506 RepID=A0ABS6F494_9CLOT|nr:LytTR family DNA-binding domain-containing protein [Clostridium simiarum]MBU5593341.1 LytTR family transcriptional regulator [Clostridium simiarum]
MQIEVSIDQSCKEPKIIILTDKITDEINEIIKRLSEINPDSMTALSEKGVEILEYKDVIRFYSENKKVFVETLKGKYIVRSRLYELEEKLDNKRFVRISNSEIVNIKKIRSMDTSITGTICVVLQGDIKTYSSRRYVRKIKQLFGI